MQSTLRDAVARVRSNLPKDIQEPRIERLGQANDNGVVYSVSSSTRSPSEIKTLLENTISHTFLAAPTIGTADAWGGSFRQICVDLDPIRLEAFGVTADLVNTQVRQLNTNLSGGLGTVGSAEESIRTLGSAPSVDALRKMRIVLPGNRWVELGKLGKVTDGGSDPKNEFLTNGKSAIGLSLNRRPGKNVVDLEKDAEQVTASVEKDYPDLKFIRLWDAAIAVKESCSATFEAMALGGLLAVIVIFLFLRDWRAALISAFAMPLSVIPTFAVMQAVGYTLNDMSLLGLALVIGILVDDAIVEIENIIRHTKKGKDPFTAAIEAADEIGLAVIATTMAAVVVFLPVAFMGGVQGQTFRQFGMTVAVSVFCSLLVARLITPVMAAYWLKPQQESESKLSKLSLFYESSMSIALKYRYATIVFAIIFFAASLGFFQALPKSLVSRIDSGDSTLKVELPAGATLKDTVEVVSKLTEKIMARPEVSHTFAAVGDGMTNKAWIDTTLKPRAERKLSLDEYESVLRPDFVKTPGARVVFDGGWGSGRVAVLLTTADSDALQNLSQELIPQIRSIPELTDIQSTAQTLKPEIQIEPDLARAAEQGVSVDTIARTAEVATIGDTDVNSAKFDLSDRQIPIVVRLDPAFRQNMNVISNLKVQGSKGQLIPLSSIAKVKLDSGILTIERYDRARQIKIIAKYAQGFSLGEALARIRQLPAYKSMPKTISDHPTGDAEQQADMFGGFGYAIATGTLLIYAVLVLLFRGFFQPFTIMMSLPLSLGGAVIALWALNKPIDMYALIGIVMLMGLVTKNAILLVEYCMVQMAQGVSRREAIFLAGRTRMRPILMTTTAMIAGMLPIAIGFGAGAEARAPMAIAVVGGLFVSTLLTLLVVPVVFTFMDDLQTWTFSLFRIRGSNERAVPPAQVQPAESELASIK